MIYAVAIIAFLAVAFLAFRLREERKSVLRMKRMLNEIYGKIGVPKAS